MAESVRVQRKGMETNACRMQAHTSEGFAVAYENAMLVPYPDNDNMTHMIYWAANFKPAAPKLRLSTCD